MILLVVLWYFLRRFDLFEKVAFVIVASFFLYYLFYIFVPVAGPQFYFPAIGFDNVEAGAHNQELLPKPNYEKGFFYSLVEGSQQVGERPTAAFPSSHVGMSTILMIMAWQPEIVLVPYAVLSFAVCRYCVHTGALCD